MTESSDVPPTNNFVAQIAALTAQVQENSNHFMTLKKDKNAAPRLENQDLQKHIHRFIAIKHTLEQPRASRSRLTAIPM